METAWLAVGFVAQAMFTMRFLVQWIASERKHESTVPVAFWYLSLVGGAMLLAYALWRRDPVFVLGQSAGLVVYVRNIMLLHSKRRQDASRQMPRLPRVRSALGRGAPWLLLGAFAALIAFAFQGTRGLGEPDEGRYAEVAHEMLVSGDYITPHLETRLHFTKPPLTYWCIAASVKLLGRSEWSVRLYLSLAFIATALLVGRIGADLWGRRTGLMAGVIYATSLTPFVGASIVTPDTLLVFWLALAVWTFFRGRSAASGLARWGWPALTGAAFGLAFLTKGPPALLFLLAMFVAAWWIGRRGERVVPVLNVTGVLTFAVFGLSWYVAVALSHEGLLSYWWQNEVLGRIAGEHHRNPQWYKPLVIYLPTLTVGAFPWVLFWPRLWRRARARLRSAGWKEAARSAPELFVLAVLIFLPLVVLSLVRSRLPLYVLPLFVPLALVTARGLGPVPAAAGAGRWIGVSRTWVPRLAVWCLVLAAARLAFAYYPFENDARRLYASLPVAPDAEIVVSDGRPHNGLGFYAARSLVYTSESGTPEDEAPTLDEEIAEVTESHLFLVRPEAALALETKLTAAGASIVETRSLPEVFAVLTDGGAAGPHETCGRSPS